MNGVSDRIVSYIIELYGIVSGQKRLWNVSISSCVENAMTIQHK